MLCAVARSHDIQKEHNNIIKKGKTFEKDFEKVGGPMKLNCILVEGSTTIFWGNTLYFYISNNYVTIAS